jgi:hypothetical protein
MRLVASVAAAGLPMAERESVVTVDLISGEFRATFRCSDDTAMTFARRRRHGCRKSFVVGR